MIGAKDHKTVWKNCLRIIEKNVSPENFQIWFRPIKSVRLIDGILTIQVPNKFFYEFLESKYIPVLRKAIKEELGPKGRLEYQIQAKASTKNIRPDVESNNETPKNKFQDEIKNPFVIPGIRKPALDPQLNANYSMENFVEGDCNKLARNAGVAIAEKPGKTAFNPMYIYGDVGLGKTHLAHAIGNATLKKNPQTRVLYVSTEKFTNQIVHAIQKGSVNDFMHFYNSVDVLIVDDVQFLAGRSKTQEIFFNIFNQLHQSGKQIILTSDRPPKDLKDLQERLISRFKWGLSADLTVPDFETRIAILQSKLDKDNLKLPRNVLEFLSYNIQSNIRELEGALISLNAQSSLTQREVDIDLAKEVVQKMVNDLGKEITVENIMAMVAEFYDIKVEKLLSRTRKQPIAEARQVSMYMAKKLTQQAYKTIGHHFGKKEHSTVIYACNTIKDLMDSDETFKNNMMELEKKIKMSLHG